MSRRTILIAACILMVVGIAALIISGASDPKPKAADERRTTTTTAAPANPVTPQNTAAIAAAVKYISAARFVTPENAMDNYAVQLRTSTGALRGQLRKYPPLPSDIDQMKIDASGRTGKIAAIRGRTDGPDGYTVDFRTQETTTVSTFPVTEAVRGRVILRDTTSGWKVTAFTVLP